MFSRVSIICGLIFLDCAIRAEGQGVYQGVTVTNFGPYLPSSSIATVEFKVSLGQNMTYCYNDYSVDNNLVVAYMFSDLGGVGAVLKVVTSGH